MDAHIIDDLIAQEEANLRAADENVKPHQILEIGDYYVRRAHGFMIYGKILDVAEYVLDGRQRVEDLDAEEREDYNDAVGLYSEPHMKFYRFAKSYSALCVAGELGDIHLSTVEKKITAEEFETAKKRGWL
jgi:hypothetical protein